MLVFVIALILYAFGKEALIFPLKLELILTYLDKIDKNYYSGESEIISRRFQMGNWGEIWTLLYSDRKPLLYVRYKKPLARSVLFYDLLN